MEKVVDLLCQLPPSSMYVAVALLLGAEVGLLCGLLVPAASIMLAVGALAHAGRLDLGYAVLIATLAALVGDSVGYWEGRLWGHRLARGRWAGRRGATAWHKAEQLVADAGGRAVTLGRWTAFVRTLVPRLVGSAGMAYPRFLVFNAAGVLIWVPGSILAGYAAGAAAERLIAGAWVAGPAALAVVLLWLLWRRQRRRTCRSLDTTSSG